MQFYCLIIDFDTALWVRNTNGCCLSSNRSHQNGNGCYLYSLYPHIMVYLEISCIWFRNLLSFYLHIVGYLKMSIFDLASNSFNSSALASRVSFLDLPLIFFFSLDGHCRWSGVLNIGWVLKLFETDILQLCSGGQSMSMG